MLLVLPSSSYAIAAALLETPPDAAVAAAGWAGKPAKVISGGRGKPEPPGKCCHRWVA